MALALITTGLALLQPLLTRLLIDRGILAGDGRVVLGACIAMLLAALLAALIGWRNRFLHVAMSADILFALRGDLFRHLLALSPAFHSRWRSGDLLTRIDGDIAEIQRFAVDGLLAGISTVVGLAGALALMFYLSWQLSLIALVLLPAEWLFLRLLRPRIEATTRAVRERQSDLGAFLVERFGAIKTIQSMTAEPREAANLAGLQARFKKRLLDQQMLGYVTGAVPGLMTTVSNVLVFAIGGWMVIQNQASLGTLIAFSAYLGRATGPIQTLLGLYAALQRARVSLGRVFELRAAEPAVTTPPVPRSLPTPASGRIAFQGVTFGHDDRPVLKGIDLVIESGAKVGLIGLSGAGKTTMIDLLHRHFDPDAGRITLDGVDLKDLDLRELRRRIAVVAQDTVLFQGSLLDNLRYAAPSADEQAIAHAAEQAMLGGLIGRLPTGLDTDIGRAGSCLSGGERQRIAIARALLQDPLVLILDEATAAIDLSTEADIIRAVDRLFADRTRLLISHRPETLQGVDRLFELTDGRLLERETTR